MTQLPPGVKMTPMLSQYTEWKALYPDCILFFRMGDFYEMFFDDARKASEILDITLTARDASKSIPMAGVPWHAVNAYLGRIANPGLLSGAINVLTRNGSLQNVGGGHYALPGAAEEEPVQNGSGWLDEPVGRGATPAMAIAANGEPAHSDDHDEALDEAYRALAALQFAILNADQAIRKVLEIRGIRALYALPDEKVRDVYKDLAVLRTLAGQLNGYCDEQQEKLRVMSRTGRPYDEDGEV